jgi:sulfate permease, SulP family
MASLINAVLILLTMLVLASLLIDGGDRPVAAVVLDADAISQTDTDGADIISLLAGELKARGVTLALARVQPTILDLWTRAGAIDALGADQVFDTVSEAVQGVKATPVAR